VADLTTPPAAPLFDASGASLGSVDLAPEVFGIEPNIPVMHQVVTAQLAGARRGTHATKTRSHRRGGGRKPWRQKGLGRARHGSIRAPQWRGGGIAHGPQPRDYSQRTPKKMKRLALRSALSARASESAVKVVDRFDWESPKTKHAVSLLRAMGIEGKALVVLGREDDAAAKSFANLPEVVLAHPGGFTTYDVLWASTVVFTSETLAAAVGTTNGDAGEEDFVKETDEGAEA
jgi:large subunit ribosomal protein L4